MSAHHLILLKSLRQIFIFYFIIIIIILITEGEQPPLMCRAALGVNVSVRWERWASQEPGSGPGRHLPSGAIWASQDSLLNSYNNNPDRAQRIVKVEQSDIWKDF